VDLPLETEQLQNERASRNELALQSEPVVDLPLESEQLDVAAAQGEESPETAEAQRQSPVEEADVLRRTTIAAQPELWREPNHSGRTQLITLTQPRPAISGFLGGEANSVPLPMEKSARAEVLPPSALRFELVEPKYTQARVFNRYRTEVLNWVAVAIITCVAAVAAFLLGWVVGDPGMLRLVH
jgi:hypothetical protein